MKRSEITTRPSGAAAVALAAGALIALTSFPALAECGFGQTLCTGQYVGYIGARGPVKVDGHEQWIKRLPNGTYEAVAAATGRYEDARPISAEDAAAQISTYNEQYGTKTVLTRAQYEASTFRDSRTQLPLLPPPLRRETTHVSVQDDKFIESANDVVLFEYNLNPKGDAPPATGTLLLDKTGVEITRTNEGTFQFLTDFIASRGGTGRSVICGGPVGDLLSFEQCPQKILNNLLAPLRGVEVDSSSHWGFGDAKVTTDSTGRYVLPYRYASGWAYADWYGVPVSLPGVIAHARDNFWVYMRYNQLEPRIKLGGLHIVERRTAGGQGSSAWDTQHVGIEVSMLVGTGILYNEPRARFWAGEVEAGPIPIDDTSNRTEYALLRPAPPPAGEERAADLKDRGFLKQINRADLSNTDVYVFDMAGNLLTERKGLRANETDGLVCESPTSCTLPPGDYQARFNFQGIINDPGVDARLKIVVINRATGYIGTGFGSKRGTELPMIVLDHDIRLRPPNLTIKLERKRKDGQPFAVGFEGSGLISDTLIVASTTWTDWDGSPLPAQLTAGYTGRIARVVEPNRLEADVDGRGTSGLGMFPITPGVDQTHVIKVPNGSDVAHFYLHVSGDPVERNPDFSELTDGSSALRYRPAHYVPFKVQVFDDPGDTAPGDDLTEFYESVYRPEHHFSLLDLDARNLDIVTDEGRTNILDDPDARISGDINAIEFIYNLFEDELPELERIGEERTYVISIGGVEKTITIGADGTVTWQASDFGEDIDPAALVGVRLVQEGDEGNVLEEYGLALSFDLTPAITDGQAMISADVAIGQVVGGVKIGFTPVDPKNVIRWEFMPGHSTGNLSAQESETDGDGLVYVDFSTSQTAGHTYQLTGYLDRVKIDGKTHELDPPYRATTTVFKVACGRIPPSGFQGIASRQNFPADGTTLTSLDILLNDSWGNKPENGTPVTWQLEGFGTVEGAPETLDGTARGWIRAPVFPGRQRLRVIVDGNSSPSVDFQANQVVANLGTDRTALEIGSGDRAILTARFQDVQGNPVAQGTPVAWTQTNGLLTVTDTGPNAGKVTDSEGRARAELAVPADSAEIGPIRVIATVASTTAATPIIQATSSAVNTLRPERTAIVLRPGNSPEDPMRTIFTDSLIGAVEPIPIYAEAPIVVTGNPGQRPKLTLKEYGIGPLLTIDGLNPDGTVTIGPDNRANVRVKRRPEASFFPSAAEGLPETVPYAMMCMDIDGDETCEWETKIGVFAEDASRVVGSFTWGFATGLGEDPAAMAGDFASSWIPYGDGRDLVVTGLQAYHVVPGEPNPVVAGMSAMSMVPFPAINEATGVIKILAKQVHHAAPFLAVIVKIVNAMNKSIDDAIRIWNQYSPFFRMLIRLDKPVRDSFVKIIKDEKTAEVMANICSRLERDSGQTLVTALARFGDDTDDLAKYIIHVYGGTNNRVLEMLGTLTTEEMDEVLTGLAKLKGKVDPAQLSQALNSDFIFGPGYMQRELIRELGELSDISGLESVVKMLKVKANQVHGFKFEIQVAAAVKRGEVAAFAGCAVKAMSVRTFKNATTGELNSLKTDIDTFLECGGENIAVQVKRGGALGSNRKGLERWAKKVLPSVGGKRENLRVVLPHGTPVSDDVREFLDGPPLIPIIFVKELNPLR
jgi:hypothetical protein